MNFCCSKSAHGCGHSKLLRWWFGVTSWSIFARARGGRPRSFLRRLVIPPHRGTCSSGGISYSHCDQLLRSINQSWINHESTISSLSIDCPPTISQPSLILVSLILWFWSTGSLWLEWWRRRFAGEHWRWRGGFWMKGQGSDSSDTTQILAISEFFSGKIPWNILKQRLTGQHPTFTYISHTEIQHTHTRSRFALVARNLHKLCFLNIVDTSDMYLHVFV